MVRGYEALSRRNKKLLIVASIEDLDPDEQNVAGMKKLIGNQENTSVKLG